MDVDETNMAATIGNITRAFNEESKFPEMDAYMASRLFSERTAISGPGWEIPASPTKADALEIFARMSLEMDNKRVPATGRVLYATPEAAAMLGWEKREAKGRGAARGMLTEASRIDGTRLETVPPELMMTAYDFDGPRGGFEPLAGARQIHMLPAHPSAVLSPLRYSFARLDPPSAGSQGKWMYYEESVEGVFVLRNKADGVQMAAAPAPAKAPAKP